MYMELFEKKYGILITKILFFPLLILLSDGYNISGFFFVINLERMKKMATTSKLFFPKIYGLKNSD